VIRHKAKRAFELNKYNPILVEDVSLDIKGWDNKPGTLVKYFVSDIGMRKRICEEILIDKDRSALARILIGIYDGREVHIWEGSVEGTISKTLKGNKSFGFDDMFIPNGYSKTFAQMEPDEKDTLSMRGIALKKFKSSSLNLNYPIFQLPEPYGNELKRVQINKLTKDTQALNFAFDLECLNHASNKVNKHLSADKYKPINIEENIFYNKYSYSNSNSLGLLFTDTDRNKLKTFKNGNPIIWQMGPERRFLALAQRAEYFLQNQNQKIHDILDNLEKNKENFPKRNNKKSITVEEALDIEDGVFTQTKSVKEIGYKKISSDKNVSRTKSSEIGLFNIIGKYPRSIYSVGCLPAVSGYRDVIITSILGHMPVFVHRNSLVAVDENNRINLIKDVIKSIKALKLKKSWEQRALNNIGAALGCNPKKDLEIAKLLYSECGVKLFRIYTINSDPRVIETAKALRSHFGNTIEIFVGQIADIKQAEKLISPTINVDGLVYGHGGGRQCTSATNGMALTTLEELYDVLKNKKFNNTTILVEGGIKTYVGGLLVLGVDGILRNAQFTNCVIEQGDIYFEHKEGKPCMPYHGSASATTMIIESSNPDNAVNRLNLSGRTKKVEGKRGYIFYKERANSMAFYIDIFKHYASRTLADLGVNSIWELREFLEKNDKDLLRIVSFEAKNTSIAWKR